MNPSSLSQPPVVPTKRIVGRDREQQVLNAILGRMFAGGGSLVLVSGEAGIGKTSLVDWLADQARRSGVLQFKGACFDLTTTPPYGPWRELLRRYVPSSNLPQMPDFISDPVAMAALGSQEALFDGALQFFQAIAERLPILLMIEDLHWADQASLDLLRFVARHIRDDRLLLVATYRDDELTLDHHLSQLLPSLVRESDTTRMALSRLKQPAISAMVKSYCQLGPSDHRRLANWLTEMGGGNPLFTEELLHDLIGQQLAQDGAGCWRLDNLQHTRVPQLLRQVIDRRLIRLSAGARRLIELAAVIGHEIPLDLWQNVCGLSGDTFRVFIEEFVNGKVILELPNHSGWKFNHALIRHEIYQSIPLLERRSLHRTIGEYLETASSTNPDAIAYHFKQSGDTSAYKWYIQAAVRAWKSYAWSLAIDHLKQAMSLLANNQIVEQGWLSFHIGRLCQVSDPRTALEHFLAAQEIANRTSSTALLACATFAAGVMYTGTLDFVNGFHEMESAIRLFENLPPAERAWLNQGDESGPTLDSLDMEPKRDCWDNASQSLSGLLKFDYGRRGIISLYLAGVGRLADARNWLQPHLSSEDPALSPTERPISFMLAYATLFGMVGDPVRAVAGFRSVRNTSVNRPPITQLTDAWLQFDALIMPYQTDNLALRVELVDRVEHAGRFASGAIPTGWSAKFGLSLASVMDGSWNELLSWTSKTNIEHGPMLTPHRLYAALAAVAYYQGRSADCLATVSYLFPDGPESTPGNVFILAASLAQRIAARLALQSGDLCTACAWIESYDRWLGWSQVAFDRADSELLWAEYHLASGNRALARQHARSALALASEPRQPLALIAVHRFLGHLYTGDASFKRAENHLQESLCLADACAAPFERALTFLRIAELRAAQDRRPQALSSLEGVRRICEPLGAKPTLSKVNLLESQLADGATSSMMRTSGLTERQLDVLRLATSGLSDPEIAQKLFISTRTVNSHMSSIFGKLGVNSRTAAAVWANTHGILDGIDVI